MKLNQKVFQRKCDARVKLLLSETMTGLGHKKILFNLVHYLSATVRIQSMNPFLPLSIWFQFVDEVVDRCHVASKP